MLRIGAFGCALALVGCTSDGSLPGSASVLEWGDPAIEDGDRVQHTDDGLRLAPTRGDLSARFDARGAVFETGARSNPSFVRLSLLRIGRRGRERAADSGTPIDARGEVRVARGAGVLEWWRAVARGIEHGFTIDVRPPGTGSMAIELDADPLTPVRVADAIELRDSSGAHFLYGGLVVRDADGALVPASMEAEGQRIRMLVDDRRARYPIVVDPLMVSGSTRLVVSFGAEIEDHLGEAVAVSDLGTVVGGAPTFRGDVDRPGEVWVYRPGSFTSGINPTTTTPEYAFFGASVAIDGDTVVVGAENESTTGSGNENGAVYTFVPDIGSSSYLQTGRIPGGPIGARLGSSVAVDGNAIAAGAPYESSSAGAVQVYTRDGTPIQTLTAPDAGPNRGFGRSLSLSGGTLFIGQNHFSNTMTEHAYVYVWNGSQFDFLQTLDSGGIVGDDFGSSVSVSGSIALVGAPGRNANEGAAYVFIRDTAGMWQRQQTLSVGGTASFGGSVSISGTIALVGAIGSESAYFFTQSLATGMFAQEGSALTGDQAGSQFGASVALRGTVAVVGAPREDVAMPTFSGFDDGALFRYMVSLTDGSPCTADTASVCASGFCAEGVCCNAACNTGCNTCVAASGAPADGTCGLRASGALCRPPANGCDIIERCDGVSAMCPADMTMPNCDAGPPPADAGRDGGAVPHVDLSCVCRAVPVHGADLSCLAIGLLAVIAARRRRTRKV